MKAKELLERYSIGDPQGHTDGKKPPETLILPAWFFTHFATTRKVPRLVSESDYNYTYDVKFQGNIILKGVTEEEATKKFIEILEVGRDFNRDYNSDDFEYITHKHLKLNCPSESCETRHEKGSHISKVKEFAERYVKYYSHINGKDYEKEVIRNLTEDLLYDIDRAHTFHKYKGIKLSAPRGTIQIAISSKEEDATVSGRFFDKENQR